MKYPAMVLFVYLLSLSGAVFAVDADGDDSDSVEEALAGTSDSDATKRPYWWKTFNGDSSNDGFGYTSSNAGDVNNDGYMDIIVGALGDDNNGTDSGSVRILSGANGSILYTFNGDATNDDFGRSVSGVGDVNNDGYDDVIATSSVTHPNSYARLFSGINGSIIHSFYTTDDALMASGGGDINNDGYDDVVVSNYNNKIYIHSGYDNSVIRILNVAGVVAGGGDVNNDGYDDLVVGYESDGVNGVNSGSVSVYNGLDGALLYKSNGDIQDWLGRKVAFVGDLNKDGYIDYAGGAIEHNNGGGYVRIFSGHNGSVIYQIPAPKGALHFGESLAPAGDINNDNYEDIIIGAPYSNKGWAFIYSGYDGVLLATMSGENTYDHLGDSVGSIGDINQDGYDDVFIGNASDDNNGKDSGSVRICLGWNLLNDIDGDYSLNSFDMDDDGDGVPDSWEVSNGFNPLVPDADLDMDSDRLTNLQEYQFGSNPLLLDTDADESSDYEEFLADTDPSNANERPYWTITLEGDFSGHELGASLSAAGDINNDGYPDFIAGGHDNLDGAPVGAVRVYSGKDFAVLHNFFGDDVSDGFGSAVDGAGDVNGDGYSDIIVGAFLDDSNGTDSGSVKVFSGVDGSLIHLVNGDSAGDKFGLSVSDVGDINDDGYADFMVGAIGDDNIVSNGGSVKVFSGINAAVLYAFNGNVVDGNFGRALSNAGDVNNDGYSDILIGAHYVNALGPTGVFVFSGINGSALYSFSEVSTSNYFGYSVSGAGDVNADGYDDFVVGAYEEDVGGLSGAGRVRVYSGVNGSILYIFDGSSQLHNLGHSVSSAGDVNADGYADIVVGGSYARYAKIYSGLNGRILYNFQPIEGCCDDFGVTVSGVGDLDHDGYDDILVGAPAYMENPGFGAVRVYRYAELKNDIDLDYLTNTADLDDDGDAMPDVWEISYGLNPLFNDAADDFDGDRASNLLEYQNGKNPSVVDNDADADGVNDLADNCQALNNPDQQNYDNDYLGNACDADDDNDGMPDNWEDLYGLNPLNPGDASIDADGDGASNLLEFSNGFNPTLPDGDADNDGINILVDNCPGISNVNQLDTEMDGQGDVCDSDDDNDEMPDLWEMIYGLNPLNASDAGIDSDGDGYKNLFEYQKNMNPLINQFLAEYDLDADHSSDGEELTYGTDHLNPVNRPYWRYTFNGDSASDFFGYSVAGAGDVNGDGYADVIVGAYQDDNNAKTNSGSARVLSGINGAILYTFNGDSASDYFGYSVAGAGDVNNDGYADVVVGAYLDDNNAKADSGSARILNGINGAVLYTFNGDGASDYFGYSVASAGDVNNDGYADVIVGAYQDDNNGSNSGSARVLSGANGGILYTFNGDSASDNFGYSVSGAGDVNNDGYADVIVGAYQDDNNGSNSGSVRVLSGINGSILYTFNGDSASDFFGYAVSDAGDVNGDGYADVIVGAYQDDNNAKTDSGSARVLSGINGAILYTFNGDGTSDYFGYSVASAGDVNSDGYFDVVIGAPQDDNKGSNSGSVRILSGLDGAILYTMNGDSANDRFGNSVANAGDVDNDGRLDIIVGAYQDDNLGSNAGSARLLLSFDLLNDTDLDFWLNAADAFPNNPNEWLDTDSDEVGNNADTDDDNDGLLDVSDVSPLFFNDTDNDLIGDGFDWDDDNDGVLDTVDAAPLDSGNSNEIPLPLDGTFKGGTFRGSVTGQQ